MLPRGAIDDCKTPRRDSQANNVNGPQNHSPLWLAASSMGKMREGGLSMKWICTICGYVHEGEEPPDTCPQCGAPKEKFEPMDEE